MSCRMKLLLCALSVGFGSAVSSAQTATERSGGPLSPEQAAYDVISYDLALRVDPQAERIDGRLIVRATVVSPLSSFVFDLDPRLEIASVHTTEGDGSELPVSFTREEGRVRALLPEAKQAGDEAVLRIEYGGAPRTGPDGAFSSFAWSETPSGAPWISVNCEGVGADIWWPCKDHPSDEPESMSLHVTVPKDLKAICNGRLREVTPAGEDEHTWHWEVSTPINNYCVTLNVAPYVEIAREYESVCGEVIPVFFWVLPEHEEQARASLPEFLDHMRHFEELLGPYPFRADKYGIAETPYMGMEHQTVIAYGGGFRDNAMGGVEWGFDGLHQHELSHEWFGNLVTPGDWKDLWLNEGFATYAQVLYADARVGREKVEEILADMRERLREDSGPIAPREPSTAIEGFRRDVYWKGALVLHSLRHLIGDEDFFRLLRRWCYPDPELEKVTDGGQCRFVDSQDFIDLAEEVSGRELDWFFELYLRRGELPRLEAKRTEQGVELTWSVPEGMSFPMPVDVTIDGEPKRVELPQGRAVLPLSPTAELRIDPDHDLLRESGGN